MCKMQDVCENISYLMICDRRCLVLKLGQREVEVEITISTSSTKQYDSADRSWQDYNLSATIGIDMAAIIG